MKWKQFVFALLAASMSIAAVQAQPSGQAYPSRPVRIVVPFAPGGATDIIARIVAQKLSERFGQAFHVDNQPGAAGKIGTGMVAKTVADGYTILIVGSGFVVNPALHNDLPYDPIKDFAPVTVVAASPNVLVVNPSVPAANVKELVALIKANPAKYSFASPGTGTLPHLSGELFKLSQQLDLVHVPFNGAGPATISTIGGHTPIAFLPIPNATPAVQQGTLRALAVTSAKRSTALPSVPTVSEVGLLGQEAETFQAMLLPAGTPRAIVDILYHAVVQLVALPDVKAQFKTLGFDPIANAPSAFAEEIKIDIAKWRRVIREANIKAE